MGNTKKVRVPVGSLVLATALVAGCATSVSGLARSPGSQTPPGQGLALHPTVAHVMIEAVNTRQVLDVSTPLDAVISSSPSPGPSRMRESHAATMPESHDATMSESHDVTRPKSQDATVPESRASSTPGFRDATMWKPRAANTSAPLDANEQESRDAPTAEPRAANTSKPRDTHTQASGDTHTQDRITSHGSTSLDNGAGHDFSQRNVVPGSYSAVYGNSPLGSGYYSTGYVPFITSGYAGYPGIYAADLGQGVYQLPTLGVGATSPVLSSGGQFLTYIANGQLEVLDMASQLIQTFPQLDGIPATSLGCTDVDAFGDVTYVDAQNEVHIFDTRSGQDFIVPAASAGLSGVRDLSIAGNGQFLTFDGLANGQRSLFMTNLLNGQQYSLPYLNSGLGTNDLANFQLSSDGNALLYSDGGQVRVLDPQTGLIDDLPVLNQDGPVQDARFLDAANTNIVFERRGVVQVYNRTNQTINLLPLVNQPGSNSLLDNSSNLGFGSLGLFHGAFS